MVTTKRRTRALNGKVVRAAVLSRSHFGAGVGAGVGGEEGTGASGGGEGCGALCVEWTPPCGRSFWDERQRPSSPNVWCDAVWSFLR